MGFLTPAPATGHFFVWTVKSQGQIQFEQTFITERMIRLALLIVHRKWIGGVFPAATSPSGTGTSPG
ncbi:hypothetical protein [Pleomorphomonas sp. T1.2MG-36]|uniref:hypothetical protein n=1 Tax=Pleomorphomonas sp. T1.2MG-36 TaxID=3041167 RepID=UPI002540ED8D|nr:hypothetical protein [Pleomorphomonas sp. T1.2MG-36]